MVTDEFQQNTQPLTISYVEYPSCIFLNVILKCIVLITKECMHMPELFTDVIYYIYVLWFGV